VSTRLVSVVVPTKDVGRTIRRCLESIRAQDHRELELIVVDNFSGDATFGVAQELADVAVQGVSALSSRTVRERVELLPQGSIPSVHAAAIVDTGARHLEERTRAAEREALGPGEVDVPPAPACAYHFFALISSPGGHPLRFRDRAQPVTSSGGHFRVPVPSDVLRRMRPCHHMYCASGAPSGSRLLPQWHVCGTTPRSSSVQFLPHAKS